MTLNPAERLRDDHFFLRAQRWIHRLEVDSLTLTCSRDAGTPLGTTHRPALESTRCLQDLPSHRLLDLRLAGVRELVLSPTTCCGPEELTALAQRWRDLLGDLVTMAVQPAATVRTWTWSMTPGRVPVDRRGLLGLSRRSEAPWPIHDPTHDDDARYLGSLRAAGMSSVEHPPPGVWLSAAGCTACGVCVAACPHDALVLDVDGAVASLRHVPDLCRGEQQCVALCPEDALTVARPLAWADVLDGEPRELATVDTSVCERCRARFPADSGSRWCETCRIHRSDPFGSHLPAAAIALLRARGHEQHH